MPVSGYWIFKGNYLFLSSTEHPGSSICSMMAIQYVTKFIAGNYKKPPLSNKYGQSKFHRKAAHGNVRLHQLPGLCRYMPGRICIL